MCLFISSFTTPVPSVLLQSIIQNLQYQHFFIFNHARPAWFCLCYAHFWGRATAISEFPHEQPESLPHAEANKQCLTPVKKSSSCLAAAPVTVMLCLPPPHILQAHCLLSPQALPKDKSCTRNQGPAYCSLLIDVTFAYSKQKFYYLRP